ncbi:MAG TPA: hypothetical protein VFV07_14345 [Rhizomicrobium sp.]|nr:hypothetical protein [Rhizomicrobium sp.]
MKKIKLFAIAIFALGAQAACADPVYVEDFQSGKSTDWMAMGQGDVRLSTYAGNVSLQLKDNATAVHALSTAGFDGVVFRLSFAGQSLGGCVADVSSDRGHHWTEIYRIGHGQDDAVTMRAGGAELAAMDNQPNLVLRLRAEGAGATCWADNIAVTGEKRDRQSASPALSPSGVRTGLTFDEMRANATAAMPVDTSAFAPPSGATAPSHVFEGRLKLGPERPGGVFHAYVDKFGDAEAARHLPDFDFGFVQSGDALIPVRRGAIPSAHPEWEFILEPGRVWDEAADHGMTRAAIPFALEERNANCMHNGILTFLFGKDGAVSDAVYQIASETCFYFKFDLWGRAAAHYTPEHVADRDGIIVRYAHEVSSRLPAKPIEMLAHDVPGADASKFGSPVEIPRADMTLFGVVANGTNYVGGCATRFGAYPYCEVMDLPSYSLAKSIFAGLGTMRLSLLYPGVTREHIAQYVPQCAAAKSWDDVTFANQLDMGSGHYNSAADQADEDAADIGPFFAADSHAGKIAFACTHYPRKAAPGTQWVYHTADTYILGTALSAFVHKKMGADADLYRDVMSDGLWKKLDLSPPTSVTRRTYDATAQPFTGYGLTLHRDDIAKIADFINRGHGAAGGAQLVDPAMLRAALQQDEADPGLQGATDEYRYHDGFWAWNAARYLGCRKPTWIPFMSGYGGIAVALMPNGMTYYYFSDSGLWRWAGAAVEADRIKPFCER